MDIFYNDVLLLTVDVGDNSYSYHRLMGEDRLVLYFSLPEYVSIPIGVTCSFDGKTYKSFNSCNVKKVHNRNFEYTLTLLGPGEIVRNYILRETVVENFDINAKRNIKFSFTGTLEQHLTLLVNTLRERSGEMWYQGIFFGALSGEKCLDYNSTNCLDALNYIASEFETEWEIVGNNSIYLRKVEYNKDKPLPLSYGYDNGFKSGVGRVSENPPIGTLFVQGGDRNIDPSRYNYSKYLLLPKSVQIGFDGTYFDTDTYYNRDAATIYETDENGFFVRPQLGSHNGVDGSIDLSNVYPSYNGSITSVSVVDASRNFYDIQDLSNDIDFNNYLIVGERLRVVFQDGMLEGKEFDVKYHHSQRKFEIVPTQIDGVIMPNNIFCPVAGNSYSVFGMMLPSEYICNNVSKTGASWDMLREAVVYLHERKDEMFTFSGELDGIWSRRQWSSLSDKLIVGGYVLFGDQHFQVKPILLRIVGVKKFVNNQYSPQIELSNAPPKKPITTVLNKVKTIQVFGKRLEDMIELTRLYLERKLSLSTGEFILPYDSEFLKKGRVYVDKTGGLKIKQ